MALPSQIERSTQMSRPVMGRTSGRRGPASLPTPVLATVAFALLAAGGWGLWYVAYRDQSPLLNNAAADVKTPAPAANPLAGLPGGTQPPSTQPAGKVSEAVPAPVELRQATTPGGVSSRPAGSLGAALGQPAAQPGTPLPAGSQPPAGPGTATPPATTDPAKQISDPAKQISDPAKQISDPAKPGTDPTKPLPVDVSRPDMKPGEAAPGAGPGIAPPPVPGEMTSTASTQGVRAMIEAGDRSLAAGKLVEARATYSKALTSPEAAKGDQEVLRQKLTTINEDLVFSARVTPGDELTELYTVVSGDALEKIRKKRELTTEWALIQRVNKMASPHALKIGQKLKLVRGPFHAVVHKADYRMDLFAGSPDEPESWIYIRSFKVGLGAENGTPLGTFSIKSKMQNPDWRNPRTGEKFDKDDPKNPIGEYWLGWLGLGDSAPIVGYGLHGTVEPESIGQSKSMGCVRLHDEDIKLVYELLAMRISIVKVVP